MKKKYFIISPFDFIEGTPPLEISGKGINQSIEVLARICEKAQPMASVKSMIIKIHYPDMDVRAYQTAEQLVDDLINGGYKNSIFSGLSEELSEALIAEKIEYAELYDASKQTPILCGFVSQEIIKDDIHFEEIKV